MNNAATEAIFSSSNKRKSSNPNSSSLHRNNNKARSSKKKEQERRSKSPGGDNRRSSSSSRGNSRKNYTNNSTPTSPRALKRRGTVESSPSSPRRQRSSSPQRRTTTGGSCSSGGYTTESIINATKSPRSPTTRRRGRLSSSSSTNPNKTSATTIAYTADTTSTPLQQQQPTVSVNRRRQDRMPPSPPPPPPPMQHTTTGAAGAIGTAAAAAAAAVTATAGGAKKTGSSAAATTAVSTKSRVTKGHNGNLQWIIHMDTPGGHSQSRLQLVTAVEAWEEDQDGFDMDDTDAYTDDDTLIHKAVAAVASKAAAAVFPEEDLGDESIIDIEFDDYVYGSKPPAVPDRALTDQQPQPQQHKLQQPQFVVPATQAREQSLQQSSHHNDPSPTKPKRQISMQQPEQRWTNNRLVQPQIQQPPPPPPPMSAPLNAKQQEQQQLQQQQIRSFQPHIQSPPPLPQQQLTQPQPQPQQPPTVLPSNKFIPRPVSNNKEFDEDEDDDENEGEERNFCDSRTLDGTFAETIGDDTLEGSGEIPMWQFDEFERSQTWGQGQDFSASYDEDDDEADHDTSLQEDDELTKESSELLSANHGEHHNYKTNTTTTSQRKPSLRLPKNETSSQQQARPAEVSIDPYNSFLSDNRRTSPKNDQLPVEYDSLADIQDSFACDTTGDHPPQTAITRDRSNQTALVSSATNKGESRPPLRSQSTYSQSLSSLPEDRVFNEESSQQQQQAIPHPSSPTVLMKRTVGVLSKGSNLKRGGGGSDGSGGSSTAPSPLTIRGSRKGSSPASQLSSSQHQQQQQSLLSRPRHQKKNPDSASVKPSNQSVQNSVNLVPNLASQFADAFLGVRPDNLENRTTSSESNAGVNQKHNREPENTRQLSVNSLTSTNSHSESSSSIYSFGIPGLRANNRHEQGDLNPYKMPIMTESTPFVQFNVKAADGVKVIHRKEEDVESRNKDAPNMAGVVRRDYISHSKSDDGLSIDEFNANAMPPLIDLEHLDARKPMSRGLSLLGPRRATPPAKAPKTGKQQPQQQQQQQQQTNEQMPFKTPIISNRRFLRRINTPATARSVEKDSTTNKRSESDLVKRFFAMANASFGSMASAGELMEDSDEEGFA